MDITAERREIEVYAAVLRHHLTERLRGEPAATMVYVWDQATADAADPMRNLAAGGGVPIRTAIRDELARRLADLARITFVADRNTVMAQRNGCVTVNGGGLVLTLAPVPTGGDRLEIGLGDFRNCLDGRWQTYVVTAGTGGWVVAGTTGPVSIS